jgi:membrane associated rhomboid family serine protease
MSESDRIGRLIAGVRQYPATVGVIVVLLVVYALQLLSAARSPVESHVPGTGTLSPPVAKLLAPWLHDDLRHLFGNMVRLGVPAILIEREKGGWRLLGFIFVSGYVPLWITSHVVYGGKYANGISGAAYAALSFGFGMVLLNLRSGGFDDSDAIACLQIFTLVCVLYPLLSFLYVLGVFADPNHVAVEAHAIAVVLGIARFCIELRRGVLQPR